MASHPLRFAVVVGAGTMGARIAAHLANAGVDVQLVDVDAASAARGWKQALALKPDPLFTRGHAARVRTGKIDDAAFGAADWVIEAIVEQAEPKRALFARIDAARGPGTVVSSNTSGLPLAGLAEGRSDAFAAHFLGTHFFNPPRYMPLVEVIPVAGTSPAVLDRVRHWLDVRMGRSVVVAKDSPNFIANHIGLHALFGVLRAWEADAFDIETLDVLTGPLIGRPKSATFRTIDITGLDVAARVARNFSEGHPDPAIRAYFAFGPRVSSLLEKGWIGEKAGRGFYAKDGRDILVLDPATMTYGPRSEARRPPLDALRDMPGGLRGRLRALLLGDSREADFTRATLGATLLYTARIWPTIAQHIDDVDRAMRWGFGWELGPFEIMDVVGYDALLRAMQAAPSDTVGPFRDQPLRVDPPELTLLANAHDANRVVTSNSAASVLDTGDGIFAVDLHSKMNTLGGDTLAMIQAGLERATAEGVGLIVATQAPLFSAGANLMLLLMEAQDEEWDAIDAMVRAFQQTVLSLRDAPVPVVFAINGLTLGGACEMALHADAVQAAAETYIGLPEVGVGLIPAGCGTKELAWRAARRASTQRDLLPFVQQAFETIGFAAVSTSAAHAQTLGFLDDGDGITMHRSRLHVDARARVQALAAAYRPGHAPAAIPVGGPDLRAALELGVHLAWRGGRISDHDRTIGRKLSWVISGGGVPHATEVSEAYLLDLEREAFLSLCGEPLTQARMAHTLRHGKPLRN